MVLTSFLKDPDSILDYSFDWSDWLESGESISSHIVVVDSGITVDDSGYSSTVVTIWLSGGTAGTNYNIACKIVTSESRTVERSITIRCRER